MLHQTLFLIIVQRSKRLQAMRADDYHWRRVSNPSELVDLDIVVLGTAILDSGRSISELAGSVSARSSLVALPVAAAISLRRSAEPEGEPRETVRQ